jgi:hypothetical protein
MPVAQLIAQGLIQTHLDLARERAQEQYNRRPRRRKRRVRWPLALAKGSASPTSDSRPVRAVTG